jgi:nucleotide-binding universal stress UspA family protein
MIKDVLAIVDTEDRDTDFLKAAIGFAELHDAHLTVMVLSAIPNPDYVLAFGPPYVLLDDYVKRTEQKQERVNELVRHLSAEVRVLSDGTEELLRKIPVHARYADLVLIGPAKAYAVPKLRQKAAEAVVLSSGRPLIVLPDGYTPRTFKHLAIGWNASREATRALKDAVGLLAAGATIDVLVVDGEPDPRGHGSEPGADIAHHLARHGFVVTIQNQPGCGDPVAETLVSLARRRNADLLAIGGYAHSRLSELILGGVTRDLLHDVSLPCLLSH